MRLLTAFVVLSLLAGLAVPAALATPRQLTWDDLVPPAPPLKHPFAHLAPDIRLEIEIIAGVRAMAERGLVTDANPTAEDTRERERKLAARGVDVEGLLDDFEETLREVEKRNAAVVAELDGQSIRMPGYALPLEFDGTAVEELLLVPYVGACIHVPPPPQNQMVLVKLDKPYVAKDLFEPVWIVGRMKVQSATKRLYLVDGEANVEAGYTLEAARAEPYGK